MADSIINNIAFHQITLGNGPSTEVIDQFCFVGNGIAIINMSIKCNAVLTHNDILATNLPKGKSLCIAAGTSNNDYMRKGIIDLNALNFKCFWSEFKSGVTYTFNFCYPII